MTERRIAPGPPDLSFDLCIIVLIRRERTGALVYRTAADTVLLGRPDWHEDLMKGRSNPGLGFGVVDTLARVRGSVDPVEANIAYPYHVFSEGKGSSCIVGRRSLVRSSAASNSTTDVSMSDPEPPVFIHRILGRHPSAAVGMRAALPVVHPGYLDL